MCLENEVNDIPTRVIIQKIFHSYTCGVDDVNKQIMIVMVCIYNYLCNQYLSPLMFEPRSWRGVLDTTLCDTFVSDLRQIGDFLLVLRYPQSINLTTMIPSQQSTNQLNKINTTDYLSNCHTSGSFWWSCVLQSSNVFIVDYGLLLNITAF